MRLGWKMGGVAVASVLGYLGLAVLGWDGVRPFFGHPARVALTIVLVGLTAASFFTDGNLNPGDREDRGNRWVLWAFAVIGVLLGWLPAYSDRTEILTVDGDAARWAGVALFAVGGTLRLWPVFVLGRRFSGLVAIQPGHELVTTGVYGIIRHPSYLGMILSVVGWALAFRSGLGLALAAMMLIPIVARIRSEEWLLGEQFGDAYQAYRARTWRLIPGVY